MENKRSSGNPSDVECRLLIPSKVGGAVIGKKGGNIQKLRSDFDSIANIRIPDAPGPERIMSVSASNVSDCCQIIEAAFTYMFEDQEEDTKKEIRVLFHQSIVGGIIGKGGSKIQEIRESSGANIRAYQNCAPASSERIVSIKGSVSDIVMALQMCLEVGEENSSTTGRGAPYDPVNFDVYYSEQYGGWGSSSDPKYANHRSGPPPFNHNQAAGGFHPRDGGYMGRGGGRGYGRGPGYDGRDQRGGFNGMGNFGESNSSFMNSGGRSFGNFNTDLDDDSGPTESHQVTIHMNMAGAIIGPGGQRIRRIRAESRANISIGDANESEERVITIEGSNKQIQVAQYLLQQAVREHHSGGGGGGSGGPGRRNRY